MNLLLLKRDDNVVREKDKFIGLSNLSFSHIFFQNSSAADASNCGCKWLVSGVKEPSREKNNIVDSA